jgi:hypothetical protein
VDAKGAHPSYTSRSETCVPRRVCACTSNSRENRSQYNISQVLLRACGYEIDERMVTLMNSNTYMQHPTTNLNWIANLPLAAVRKSGHICPGNDCCTAWHCGLLACHGVLNDVLHSPHKPAGSMNPMHGDVVCIINADDRQVRRTSRQGQVMQRVSMRVR